MPFVDLVNVRSRAAFLGVLLVPLLAAGCSSATSGKSGTDVSSDKGSSANPSQVFAGYCAKIDRASATSFLGAATPFTGAPVTPTKYDGEVECDAAAGMHSLSVHVYRYPRASAAAAAAPGFGGTAVPGIGDDARFVGRSGSMQIQAGADLLRVDTTGGSPGTTAQLSPIAKAASAALPH